MIIGTTLGTIDRVLPLGHIGGVGRLSNGTKDVLGAKEDGASGSFKTPTSKKLFSFSRIEQTCCERNKSQEKILSVAGFHPTILAIVTPPVIIIARTSRTRKIKKSHLFFCTKC